MDPLRIPIVPRATYRLQFNAEFGFDAARRVVPYLAALGISHVYASPITMARPGSTHGYDVIDFNRLNPELGDEAAFDRLIATLHAHGMGLVLDFVPNHMGVGSDNPWWLDVLEWGQESPFAAFFDIDWEASARGVRDKLLLPVLGGQYGEVLEAGELCLVFDAESGGFRVRYYDDWFPIGVRHYPALLRSAADRLGDGPLVTLAERFSELGHGRAPRARRHERRQQAISLKAELAELARRAAAVHAALETAAAERNGVAGEPASFRTLHRLLEQQAYRLAFWRVASSEINYRRFFDINELAGLRMERPEVFEATHRLLLQLIGDGKVQGVRLDHIDGLYDPAAYVRHLLARAAEVRPETTEGEAPIYLVVEKILARHEHLRDDLPVAGTTGYEFLNWLNGVFVDGSAERSMTAIYRRFIGEERDLEQTVLAAKHQILRYALDSELHVLAHELHRLAQQSWRTRDFTLSGLREALTDVIACFPVYRTYITAEGARAEDRRDLDWAISQARKQTALLDVSVFDFLHLALGADLAAPGHRRRDVIATAMRSQQLTSPVMAKSLEDTTFYRYVRLVSLNEVGGEPQHFGVSPGAFHTLVQRRQRFHPLTMLASATHDHKRGEDTRARINVLSELPQEWRRRVARFALLNRYKRQQLDGRRVPSRNDEYLLYQTLVGAWPLEIETPEGLAESDFADRIVAYMVKAMREAKHETSWTAPDTAYESGVEQFVRRIVDPVSGQSFLTDFLPFQQRIARAGAVNGLAQTLVKLTAPGIPDTYQGTELWDLSLVDPDNRRPVDFELRQTHVEHAVEPARLLASWRDGRIKQHVVARTLALRGQHPALFTTGTYVPLRVVGTLSDHVFGFAREIEGTFVLVIVPRLVAALLPAVGPPHPAPGSWGDTQIELTPAQCQCPLWNPLTDAELGPPSPMLPIAEALADLPVALLLGTG